LPVEGEGLLASPVDPALSPAVFCPRELLPLSLTVRSDLSFSDVPTFESIGGAVSVPCLLVASELIDVPVFADLSLFPESELSPLGRSVVAVLCDVLSLLPTSFFGTSDLTDSFSALLWL
jgi:hypothetical protein